MKLLRYKINNDIKYGIFKDDAIAEINGDVFGSFEESGKVVSFADITLLPPVEPSKIIAIGLNYKEHALELSMEMPLEPLIFLKPPSTLIASGDDVVYPEMSSQVDYEGELGVVIKKRAKDVHRADAREYILGYTCINDVTARDLQRRDVQFTRAKSFDTFCPAGPFIETELDPTDAKLKTYLNGQLMQDASTSDMIFDVYFLVSYVSNIMTLEPGDLITTGTPKGVASVVRGDSVAVEIQGVGRLVNSII